MIVSDFGKLNEEYLSKLKYFDWKHVTLIIITLDNSTEKVVNIKLETINIIGFKYSDFFSSKNIVL
jgi:hypothetical protein